MEIILFSLSVIRHMFNFQAFCILGTESIRVIRIVVTINSSSFPDENKRMIILWKSTHNDFFFRLRVHGETRWAVKHLCNVCMYYIYVYRLARLFLVYVMSHLA